MLWWIYEEHAYASNFSLEMVTLHCFHIYSSSSRTFWSFINSQRIKYYYDVNVNVMHVFLEVHIFTNSAYISGFFLDCRIVSNTCLEHWNCVTIFFVDLFLWMDSIVIEHLVCLATWFSLLVQGGMELWSHRFPWEL